jgi:hypothetical protein
MNPIETVNRALLAAMPDELAISDLIARTSLTRGEVERVQGARALNAVTTPSNPENTAEPLSEAEV